MGTVYWEPKAVLTAQVTTVTVGGVLAGETFTISIGGVVMASHTDTTTVIADTVAALVAGINTSVYPYDDVIVAADTSPSLTLTADPVGLPFAVTLNVPGGGATFGQAETVASSSPYNWDLADNWDTGAVPVNADDVIIADSAGNICWGLDQSAVTLASLTVYRSYTGKIGLDRSRFTVTADGDEYYDPDTYPTVSEYRDDTLLIGWDKADFGEEYAPTSVASSARLKCWNKKAGASVTVVHSVGTAPAEDELPTMRLMFDNAAAVLYVRQASGGVGVGVDRPGEVGTIGKIAVTATTDGTYVFVGDGITLTTWQQRNGTCRLNAAAAVTTATVLGGTLYASGEYAITNLYVGEIYSDTWFDRTGNRYGGNGKVFANNVPAAGSALGTVNVYGGELHGERCSQARTWDTVHRRKVVTKLEYDEDFVTITTLDEF